MPRHPKRQQLNFDEFYATTELIKTHREQIIKTCFTHQAVADFLNSKADFLGDKEGVTKEITKHNVNTILSTMKIELEAAPTQYSAQERNRKDKAIIVNAIHTLYAQLGAVPPKGFDDLHARVNSNIGVLPTPATPALSTTETPAAQPPAAPATPPTNGVPVKGNVANTKKIEIANTNAINNNIPPTPTIHRH
jgi:predicted nucleic-acid-binding protein